MTSFEKVLRDYTDGKSNADELAARLDATLAGGKAHPGQLLKILDGQNAAKPLNPQVYAALQDRINKSIRQPSTSPGAAVDQELEHPTNIKESSNSFPPEPGHDSGELNVGSIVGGKYLLEELAGKGGMSRVYKAKDLDAERAQSKDPYLAVKVLLDSFRQHADPLVALNREFQKSTRLTHPNIVRVFHWFQEGQSVCMTMEYLDGQSLAAILRNRHGRRIKKSEAMKIIREMGSALAHAHECGIIHADFKPGNVILAKDEKGQEHVKIIDLGIARVMRDPSDLSDDKTIFDLRSLNALTPAYASPEMLANDELDARDDVYSLACVAYELLTCAPPFGRYTALQAKALGLTVKQEDGLNKSEWQALSSALALDRNKRTPSVNQFISELTAKPSMVAPAKWIAGGAAVAALILAAAFIGPSLLESIRREAEPAKPEISQESAADTEPAVPVVNVDVPAAVPKRKPGTSFRDCPDCPLLIVLPPGRFQQGSDTTELGHRAFESPVHAVTIDYPIAMASQEVTVGQYRQFVSATGWQPTSCHTYQKNWQLDKNANWSRPGFEQTDEHPVACVSWGDAQAYVNWLTETTGFNYRLPSESEWEYAARGGTEAISSWGNRPNDACRYANVADVAAIKEYPGWQIHECDDGFANTAPGASLRANKFGLYDMQGNLFEWTADCWNNRYEGAPTDGTSWNRGDCEQRVLRGGSWFTAPPEMRLTFRNRFVTDYRSSSFGLRVVREL